MLLDVVHNVIQPGERQPHIAVRRAVVDGDPAAFAVVDGGAGEAHIGHEAPLLIPLLRGQQEVLAAVLHHRGVVDVQDGPADAVHIAVAGAGDSVVEQQPPFAGLDGRRASAEHADEAVPVGHHGAVEDSNHILQGVAPDDGVLRIPPDGSAGKGLRPFLPGHIGYGGAGSNASIPAGIRGVRPKPCMSSVWPAVGKAVPSVSPGGAAGSVRSFRTSGPRSPDCAEGLPAYGTHSP